MERIKTYIDELDKNLDGGIPERHTVLICGGTGTLKTSLAYSILYHNAKNEGIRGMYFSLEQSKQDLLDQVKGLGMPITDVDDSLFIETMQELKKESKKLTMGMNWLTVALSQIDTFKKNKNFELIVLDSINALCALSKTDYTRVDMLEFFEGLKNLGLTTFVITEMTNQHFAQHDVEGFLADGIVHLSMERTGNTVSRYIHVVKMRKTRHSPDYLPLMVTYGGFKVIQK